MASKINIGVGIVFFVLLSLLPASAEEIKKPRALRDLTAVKVYYDVKTKNPKKMAIQLMLINETYDQIVKAGVQAKFIVGFRNEASNFVTKGEDDYILEEEVAAKKKIQGWVQRFKARGIIMEQCGITTEFQDIDLEDFLPGIEIIKNSYVSMIGYQAKGYSQITID